MRRMLFAGAGAVLAALLTASPASAAPGVSAPGQADLDAARQAAVAAMPRASQFLAADSATVAGDPVAVFTLNPEFVTSPKAPVATLEYVATTVTGGGRSAAVWTVKKDGAWTVVNIASGGDEQGYASAAGAGGVVFHEPQVNAWYVLRGETVSPLNADARAAVGEGKSVAAYQKLVSARYGDKLPGSAYHRSGKAGGYGEEAGGSGWAPALWLLGCAALALVVFAPRLRTR
ncbi:hypothetical protein [Longispora albida]|uniref:hypothetical protein n=1 Tax=Longispora albida TaxID=203523 RepID=UPI0009FCAF75|nr:hypothetical protein [Longispora albida]